jgi:hypothetical protein
MAITYPTLVGPGFAQERLYTVHQCVQTVDQVIILSQEEECIYICPVSDKALVLVLVTC